MKIIQITDTHLMPRGTELHGLNPCERLEACIASIKEFHADAELCIITGDLTDCGDREAYRDFRKILPKLLMLLWAFPPRGRGGNADRNAHGDMNVHET